MGGTYPISLEVALWDQRRPPSVRPTMPATCRRRPANAAAPLQRRQLSDREPLPASDLVCRHAFFNVIKVLLRLDNNSPSVASLAEHQAAVALYDAILHVATAADPGEFIPVSMATTRPAWWSLFAERMRPVQPGRKPSWWSNVRTGADESGRVSEAERYAATSGHYMDKDTPLYEAINLVRYRPTDGTRWCPPQCDFADCLRCMGRTDAFWSLYSMFFTRAGLAGPNFVAIPNPVVLQFGHESNSRRPHIPQGKKFPELLTDGYFYRHELPVLLAMCKAMGTTLSIRVRTPRAQCEPIARLLGQAAAAYPGDLAIAVTCEDVDPNMRV